MKVVLNKDVKDLGFRGDIIEVKPGYFRNFLFPNGLADYGSDSRISLAEARKEKMVMRKQQVIENAKSVVDKLKGFTLKIRAKVNEKGGLFAAITEEDIVKAIKEDLKMDISADFIKMQAVKELGEYKIKVELGDMSEEISLIVEEQ